MGQEAVAGENLRTYRLLRRVTLAQVGARLGLTKQRVWQIERAPDVDDRRSLAYMEAVDGVAVEQLARLRGQSE